MKKLREEGGFRELLPRSTWQRASQPRWGSEVHKVVEFVGPLVVDSRGKLHETKMVAPVPIASAEQDVPKELRGGNPELQAQQRRKLNMCAKK